MAQVSPSDRDVEIAPHPCRDTSTGSEASSGRAWLEHISVFPCGRGNVVAVAVDRNEAFLPGQGPSDTSVSVYSLASGSLARVLSVSADGGFQGCAGSGIAVTPSGTLLLVSAASQRLHEADAVDGRHVRDVGGVSFRGLVAVDCGVSAAAVCDVGRCSITVLSWPDGALLSTFGRFGSPALGAKLGMLTFQNPHSVKVVGGGDVGVASGCVVAVLDSGNNRLCVHDVNGNQLRVLTPPRDELSAPYGVAVVDGGLVVSNGGHHNVVAVSVADGAVIGRYGDPGKVAGSGVGQLAFPHGVASVSNDVLLVRDSRNCRVVTLRVLCLRHAWIVAVFEHAR